jgi:hypothetical protein
VLSGTGLCDGLITRPEESYRLWRVVVCDQETSKMRRLKPVTGQWKILTQWVVTPGKQTNEQGLTIIERKEHFGSACLLHFQRDCRFLRNASGNFQGYTISQPMGPQYGSSLQ